MDALGGAGAVRRQSRPFMVPTSRVASLVAEGTGAERAGGRLGAI